MPLPRISEITSPRIMFRSNEDALFFFQSTKTRISRITIQYSTISSSHTIIFPYNYSNGIKISRIINSMSSMSEFRKEENEMTRNQSEIGWHSIDIEERSSQEMDPWNNGRSHDLLMNDYATICPGDGSSGNLLNYSDWWPGSGHPVVARPRRAPIAHPPRPRLFDFDLRDPSPFAADAPRPDPEARVRVNFNRPCVPKTPLFRLLRRIVVRKFAKLGKSGNRWEWRFSFFFYFFFFF